MSKTRAIIGFLILCLILGTVTFVMRVVSAASDSSSKSLNISDLRLGAPGEKPNQEYVNITNEGTTPVNLEGWQIKDEHLYHIYTFPSYTLNAKDTVTLRSGDGINSANTLYWNKWRFIWNNIDPEHGEHGDIAYFL